MANEQEPAAHHSDYGYPDFNAARTDGTALIGHLTGNELERNHLIKAAHTVLSFGLGTAFPHDQPIFGDKELKSLKKAAVPKTKAAQVKALQKALDAGPPPVGAGADPKAAFPWWVAAQIAWAIIQQLLKR